MLREGIIDSRAVNLLSDEAEIFYRRLMSVVDDYGRCEADPVLLRVRLFARKLEEWPVARLMAVMQSTGLCLTDDGHPLVSYYQTQNGKKYLQINNFDQRLRVKHEKCPSPDGQMTVTWQADDRHLSDTCPPKRSEEKRSSVEEKRGEVKRSEAAPWALDESYIEFRKRWLECDPDTPPGDFSGRTYSSWKILDGSQRTRAFGALITLRACSERPKKKPVFWLEDREFRLIEPLPNYNDPKRYEQGD